MLRRENLHRTQAEAVEFALEGDATLLVAGVGTGKTITGYTIIRDALEREITERWLVVAPLLVCLDAWATEHLHWEHTRHLRVVCATGASPARSAAVEDRDADVVVINYENLEWLCTQYPNGLPFDGILFDELDKMKTVKSERFRKLRKFIPRFIMNVGMTGTVVPNNLLELWGQMYVLDAGETFMDDTHNGRRIGRSFYRWREKYFYPTDYNQYNWEPFPDTEKTLIKKIASATTSLRAENLPDVVHMPPAVLTMRPVQQKAYDDMKRDLAIEEEYLDVEVEHTAAAVNKLAQIASGFIYTEGEGNGEPFWFPGGQGKLEWVHRLVTQVLVDSQVLIVYRFRAELEWLQQRLGGEDFAYIGSGVATSRKQQTIMRWNAGRLRLLAINAQSAGHGLNLQHSGASDIVFVTVPWSGGLFEQVLGRLARRGQRKDKVLVHTVVFSGAIDERTLNVVKEKQRRGQRFREMLDQAKEGTL